MANENDDLQNSPEYRRVYEMLKSGQSGKHVLDAFEKFLAKVEADEAGEQEEPEEDLPAYWDKVRKTETL